MNKKYSGVTGEILKRMSKCKQTGKGARYSPELKAFALTLQFYSTKAYNYVRKTFNLALPHNISITKWYTKIPAEPGFTEPAFKALSLKVKEAEKTGSKVFVSLMLDEMSIKEKVEWDGTKWRGFVDVGDGGCDNDVGGDVAVAQNALVFMVVAAGNSGHYKVPVGYFLIKSMTGQEKANIVLVCIKKLTDIGVNVLALICDGPPSHFKMMTELGACLDANNMKTFFSNPDIENQSIFTFLDVCHMIKLVRNTFKKLGVMFDHDGNKICWHYIHELAKLQEAEGLRFSAG